MDKKIIAILAAVVVVFAVVVGGMFFWMKKIETKTKGQSPQNATASNVPVVNTTVTKNQDVAATAAKNNNDGMVEWYAAPKLIPTPQIYSDSNDFNAKTWEIGKFISGKNTGNTIILMSLYPEGPGGITIARFIKNPNSQILELLDHYSNGIYLSSGMNDINTEVLEDSPAYGVTINSLDFPGVLYTPHGEKMVKVDDFPVNNFDDNLDNIFFKNDLLKKAFADPVYGNFYVTDSMKVNKDNSSSVYGRNGFYVKAPDGTFKVYSLAIDFFGPNDVPDITWNDGQKNVSQFSYQGSTGCGASVYSDVVDNEVNISDLTPTGKTNIGDVVYEFTDKNAKYLKDFYKEDVDYVNTAESGVLEGKKFTKGMTYDQFINSHVVFFWKDTFGRITRFINRDYFADPGGCGKPVIYLYPEKTELVLVKVAPSGGFTKTEPDYGNGWKVIADPMSRLKNLADGKIYPYLFWEGNSKEIYNRSKFGFVAERDGLENLFNDKLSLLGLNQKEIGDFKEYWLPKMLAEKKPYYFVTFVPQRKVDELAPLEINPKPDSVIRVLMDYQGLDEKIDAHGYDIKTPERKGFTAVEWGGMIK